MIDTTGNIPTWLINLPRATKRGASMRTQLERIGLPYKYFPGVDGQAEKMRLLANTDVAAFERNMGRKILMGGLGCYHSHLAVWEEFLALNAPIALVLEDDVIFHDDFLEAIRHALNTHQHWDFLKLNCIRAKIPICQGMVGRYQLNAYLGPATGTGAYLVNRKTAKKLLAGMRRVTRSTDHEINRFFVHDFRLRGLEPFPSHVDDRGHSLITGSGFADIEKHRGIARWPHYRLKVANYFRRFLWLCKRGEIIQDHKQIMACEKD